MDNRELDLQIQRLVMRSDITPVPEYSSFLVDWSDRAVIAVDRTSILDSTCPWSSRNWTVVSPGTKKYGPELMQPGTSDQVGSLASECVDSISSVGRAGRVEDLADDSRLRGSAT
jgi:hypothetical protein